MKNSKDNTSYQPTKDENFIKAYLEVNNLSFKEQFKIKGLKGDENFKYRVADFYLDNLDIYVEYYDLFNSTKEI